MEHTRSQLKVLQLDVDWFVDCFVVFLCHKQLNVDASGFLRFMLRILSGADSVHDSSCIWLGPCHWKMKHSPQPARLTASDSVACDCHGSLVFCIGVILLLRIHSLRALWGLQWEPLIITGWQLWHPSKLQRFNRYWPAPEHTSSKKGANNLWIRLL